MAQEFIINSQDIEDKVNKLLPSQGGFAAGVDFSASTMVVPIIDLTETAEGSTLRQDLQSSLSLTSITAFDVNNTTTTVINTTGYYRVFGNFNAIPGTGALAESINLTDGFSTKQIIGFDNFGNTVGQQNLFDFIVKLGAGESLSITATVQGRFAGNTRQLADLSGNLVNP